MSTNPFDAFRRPPSVLAPVSAVVAPVLQTLEDVERKRSLSRTDDSDDDLVFVGGT